MAGADEVSRSNWSGECIQPPTTRDAENSRVGSVRLAKLPAVTETVGPSPTAMPRFDTRPFTAASDPDRTGKPAPDFTLKDVDGHGFTLSSLRGKAVLLDFLGYLVRTVPGGDAPHQSPL